MTDSITVSTGNFTAEIYPGNLIIYQTLTKIRKLFKLMFLYSYENAEAIRKTEEWITFAVKKAKGKWQEASVDYQNKWIFIDDKGYTIPEVKANYERMLKIQTSFLKYKGEN